MRIPRALLQEQKPVRETALHVFCDASQNAYGACAYLRRAFIDGTVECSLVAGKGRVAPLKSQSICRLELMGALVAVRLTQTLVEEMVTKTEKITFWSDSHIGSARRTPLTKYSSVTAYLRFTQSRAI